MIKKLLFYRTFGLCIFLLLGAGQLLAQCPETVEIVASEKEICQGEEVVFSLTSPLEGEVTYQWLVNGTELPDENGASFSSSSLDNGNEVSLVIREINGTPCNVTSKSFPITVNPVLEGEATIQASTAEICSGESISFTILRTQNLSGQPIYQWKRIRGGVTSVVGSTNTYGADDFEDGDLIFLSVDPAVPCVETFTTNEIEITVKGGPPSQPGAISWEEEDVNEEGEYCPGTVARFSIAEVENATSYQWTLPPGWSGPDTGTRIEVNVGNQAGTATLEVRAGNDCDYGPAQTIEVAVGPGPPDPPGIIAMTSSLGDDLICEGSSVTFSVPPTDPSLKYTWTVPSDWEIVSGEGSATIEVTAGAYDPNETVTVFTTNACSESEVSSFEFDDAHPVPPRIVVEPLPVRLCEGEGFALNVEAIGDGLIYQWYHNEVTIPGASSATYNRLVSEAADEGMYKVIVRGDSVCDEAVSSAVEVIIDRAIEITAQPSDLRICENGPLELSVSAEAGGEALVYQWYKDGIPFPGAVASTLLLETAGIADAGMYSVEISGGEGFGCQSVFSEAAAVVVRPAPTVAIEVTGSLELCDGGRAEIRFLNGPADAWVTYEFNGQEFEVALDGTGSYTLDTGSLFAAGEVPLEYRIDLIRIAYADAPQCAQELSDNVSVTVHPVPTVSLAFPEGRTDFCNEGGQGAIEPILSGTGNFSGGIFSSEDLPVDAATGAFSPSAVPAGEYTILYTTSEAGACEVVSAALTIIIYDELEITEQPSEVEVCSANSTELRVEAFGEGLSYQWYKIGETADTAVGENAAAYSIANATASDAGSYYVVVSSAFACSVKVSEPIILSVIENIVVEEQPAGQQICVGGRVEFHIAATAKGESELSYQWNYRPSGGEWTELLGETKASLVLEDGDFAAEGEYRVTLNSGEDSCSSGYSEIASLTVTPVPDASFSYESTVFCQNSGVDPSPLLTGDPGGVFSGSPGLVVLSDGTIDLLQSTPNDPDDATDMHTVYYTFAGTDACPLVQAEFQVRIEGSRYRAIAEVAAGQHFSCGANAVQLKGQIFSILNNAIVEEFENSKELSAFWSVVGWDREVSDSFFSDPTDPWAIFTAPYSDQPYELKWTVQSLEDVLCGPSEDSISVELKGCTGLDFDGIDDYVDLGAAYDGEYSIEAWIRPFDRTSEEGSTNASTGTVFSGPRTEIAMDDVAAYIAKNDRWFHIAVTNAGLLYVDGILVGADDFSGNGGERTLIGASWSSEEGKAKDFFSGWLEEVRIWKGEISEEQIRFLMNQRLKNDAHIGEEIPMTAPGLPYEDLEGYYRLSSKDILDTGLTADLSMTPVTGRLHNMHSLQENTAPLPYTTSAAGSWIEEGTAEGSGPWTHWEVWDIPNSTGWKGVPIEWNIVKLSHDLTSGDKDITVLGLHSESGKLEIASPTVTDPHWQNEGQLLRITDYLYLNGSIDFAGESQLLQDVGSIVDNGSTGFIERDQQGTASSYNYNYWTSPVTAIAGSPKYSISSVMKDGTTSEWGNLDFGYAHQYADGAPKDPRKVSSYWLYKFHGTASVYGQWYYVGTDGALNVGEGFSMKGTSGTSEIEDRQNYTFKGIPNNGEIVLKEMGENQNYLIGNPYPSALDADEFILDNLRDVQKDGQQGRNDRNTFNGSLYFWSHFAEQSHYLQEYVGGYATYTLSGGVKAGATDARINATQAEGGEEPQRYIPVGQAFFVNTAGGDYGGKVIFKNSQRKYVKKGPESVFHQQESQSKAAKKKEDLRQKIWLKFLSPSGYDRQLLVTADENTSNDYDLGYDAPLIENNREDMYWVFNNSKFVIQGVPHLNEDQELSLGMKTEKEGWISVSIDGLLNIPDHMGIYLKNTQTGEVHNLREVPYIVQSSAGTDEGRFKLVFRDGKTQAEDPVFPTDDISIVYINSSGEIVIRNPLVSELYSAVLSNLAGQQVQGFHHIPHQPEVRLPVKKLSPGVYIVSLNTAGGIVTEKIIIEE